MRTFLLLVLIVANGCASHCSCGTSRLVSVLEQTDADIEPIASTLSALDEAIRVTTDNLSNAETTAYKAARVRIVDGNAQVLHNFDQGPMENTGRQLDVAIQGNGYFCVTLPTSSGDRIGYTRIGALLQNMEGDLVVALGDGYRLHPPINLPPGVTDVTISLRGEVSFKRSGSTVPQLAGVIHVSQFVNQEGLQRWSDVVYQATDQSGMALESNPDEDGAGKTLQGFLEGSNVDRVKEQVRLNYLTRWREDLMDVAKRISPRSLFAPR